MTGSRRSALRGGAADPPQRADQPDVPDGVRELRAPGGLKVRQQVELAGVVGAVARTAAERHDTERVAAAAERPWNQVRGVDPVLGAADDARPAGDGGPLAVGRRHRRCSLRAAWFAAAVVRARSCARRRSGVRFIGCSFLSGSWDAAATASPSGRRGLVAATFAGMSIRKFAGEDGQGPFLDWVSQKPKGYVLNTDAGLSDRGSTRLHRASCFTLEPGFGGGERQTVDYIKVCSPDRRSSTSGRSGTSGTGCGACAASTASGEGRSASRTDPRLSGLDLQVVAVAVEVLGLQVGVWRVAGVLPSEATGSARGSCPPSPSVKRKGPVL